MDVTTEKVITSAKVYAIFKIFDISELKKYS